MRALISLCAAALLFAAGCSKTTDNADNPMPPADQSPTPSTVPPDQPPPSSPSDSTLPPPAEPGSPPPDQPTPPQPQ